MTRTFWRSLVTVLLLGFLTLIGAGPAFAGPVRAGVDDFTFDSFHADYTLSRADDGTARLAVVETLVARFPDTDQNRGIRRMIPALYQNVDVDPQVSSVTDENGNPRPMEVSRSGDFVEVVSRADDYLHGPQTYVISYTLKNTSRYFADTGVDEFYWDVNGNEWAQPFGDVSMTLHVDPSISGALTGAQSCYVGAFGGTDTCPITTTDPNTIEASASGVGPQETLTVAIAFQKDTFVQAAASSSSPDPADAAPAGYAAMGAAALASVAAIGSASYMRRTKLQDDPGHPTVIPQYEPPAGVDALASAVMLGNKHLGIPAEVLEQAVRGSIVLIDSSKDGWLGRRSRMSARLLDPRKSGDRDGQELLRAMFGSSPQIGDEFAFGTYDSAFASRAESILGEVRGQQVAGGVWRAVPASAQAVPILLGVLALLLGFGALFFGTMLTGHAWGALVFALCVGAFILAIAMTMKKPYSKLGADLRDHLAGLKMFMEWAEADRIRMLQSVEGAERVQVDTNDPRQLLRLYEPLLPYAVVFGIEQTWAQQLTVFYDTIQQSPYWYGSPGGFNPIAFGYAMSSMNSAVSSTTTAPSSASSGGSSSFGGSSGGGFSGGGGGGGGGGGV